MDFEYFGLSAPTAEGIRRLGFTEPTRIQAETIPVLLEGRDVVGKAETGSGKTLAFGIPLIEKVDAERVSIQALVLCPTRELAQQVALDIEKAGAVKGVKVALVVGGEHVRSQRMRIPGKQVVVGTPGRILDLLDNRYLALEWVSYFVLDEFDRLLDMGFLDDVKRIVARLPKDRQTVLFSATFPRELIAIAKSMMKSAEFIETNRGVSTVSTVSQRAVRTKTARKMQVLERLLTQPGSEDHTFIVFCNTKAEVRTVDRELWVKELSVASLSGDHDQSVRFKVLERFRRREIRILVATDLAARGLDIDHVTHVINFDVPFEVEEYVHRIGRTARAGRDGHVTTIVGDEDVHSFQRIRKQIDQEIEMLPESLKPIVRSPDAKELPEAGVPEAAPAVVKAVPVAAPPTPFGAGLHDEAAHVAVPERAAPANHRRRPTPVEAVVPDDVVDVEFVADFDSGSDDRRTARQDDDIDTVDADDLPLGEGARPETAESGDDDARRKRRRRGRRGGRGGYADERPENPPRAEDTQAPRGRAPERNDRPAPSRENSARDDQSRGDQSRGGHSRGETGNEPYDAPPSTAPSESRTDRRPDARTDPRDERGGRGGRDQDRGPRERGDERRDDRGPDRRDQARRPDGRDQRGGDQRGPRTDRNEPPRRNDDRRDGRGQESRAPEARPQNGRNGPGGRDRGTGPAAGDARRPAGRRDHRARFDYKRWEEEQLNRPVELISDNWSDVEELDDIRGYQEGDVDARGPEADPRDQRQQGADQGADQAGRGERGPLNDRGGADRNRGRRQGGRQGGPPPAGQASAQDQGARGDDRGNRGGSRQGGQSNQGGQSDQGGRRRRRGGRNRR